MAEPVFSSLATELKISIFDILYKSSDRKGCSNYLYCPSTYNMQLDVTNKTSTLLAVNSCIQEDTVEYLVQKFDTYLMQDQVAVCLDSETGSLYLHPLPLTAPRANLFSLLTEFWIVAGKFQFLGFSNIIPQLTKLQKIHLEHDMMNANIFHYANVNIVEYCSSPERQHIPQPHAVATLVHESKHTLQTAYQLEQVENTPISQRDLRWFLTRIDQRPIPNVQVLTALRCPLRLCDTCALGGSSTYFKRIEKKMTIQYDFDTLQVFKVGYVPIK